MASVAFIGLGKMGAAMASRLLEAGHQVTVYNRTKANAGSLVGRGARLANSSRDACTGVEAVFSMVADDVASRAVWLGEQGVLAAGLAPGTFAIECSTLSYDWVIELAARAAALHLRYLDAPVTGLPAGAARGALTLLVGADGQDLQRAGLDLGRVADAIATSQAASLQVVRNTRRMVEGNHDENVVFTSGLRRKDVEYALRLVCKLRMRAPFGELAESGLQQLCERGRSQANESSIFEVAVTREVESLSK